MRILISSHCYAPSTGGIETVSALLAARWAAAGHEIRIVTKTDDSSGEKHPWSVIRNPSLGSLLCELLWCDLCFQNNISLSVLLPALLLGKKTVITHQTWFPPGLMGRLKRFASRLAACTIAISEAIREKNGGDLVIPNPYDEKVFHRNSRSVQDRDIIFLGRFVPDKGAELVIEAMGLLAGRGLLPSLTLVGGGAQEGFLKDCAATSPARDHILFAGRKGGVELADLLRNHQILVVPSRWEEPFGIVALEGMACGCVVVGSNKGGLPESIGPGGILFESGNAESLADALEKVIKEFALPGRSNQTPAVIKHLGRHTSSSISRQYLRLFGLLVPKVYPAGAATV